MFDTHCHLNFKRFKKNLPEVVRRAFDQNVKKIVIPGTDVPTSQKAVEVAEKYDGLFAAVGIHPHHVFELISHDQLRITNEIGEIERLLFHPKVVAIGEVGMDRHVYKETKYAEYAVDERFIEIQKQLLRLQIQLAISHNKSLILHNREASQDMLPLLHDIWDTRLNSRTVFHCCEASTDLLKFAQEHAMFIGVDGDVTYETKKQEFIKQVPLEMLVLETDSPYILPEPLLSKKLYPNEPGNIHFIAEKVAELKNMSLDEIVQKTTENGNRLFNLKEIFE